MFSNIIFLFFEFFKTGLFTFGGGYGSLPFLFSMVENYNWFTQDELTQLIAISGITPGPIGLNMATFAGFKTLGIIGAIVSSVALVIPMIIITSRVFKLYDKFADNRYVKSILYFLRPTSCALIFSVGVKLFYNFVMKNSFNLKTFDYPALLVVLILFFFTFFIKKEPIIYMLIAGVLGIIIFFYF